MLKAALAEWSDTHSSFGRLLRPSQLRLRELVRTEQPPVWIWTEQSSSGNWESIDDGSGQQSAGVQRVEVLRDFDCAYLSREMFGGALELNCFDEDIRRPLVLRACPYLQHPDLANDLARYAEPSFDDLFASVPRLRTLQLGRAGTSGEKPHPLTLDRHAASAHLASNRSLHLLRHL